ncbi:MAG TPA: hypothetical protein VF131_26800 [Blastocatellia bacterium]|nr:hypothetical protein [Blastocatellia bacterium]
MGDSEEKAQERKRPSWEPLAPEQDESLAPQPASQSRAGLLQSRYGNAALANSFVADSAPTKSPADALAIQSTYGNSRIANLAKTRGIVAPSLQPKPETDRQYREITKITSGAAEATEQQIITKRGTAPASKQTSPTAKGDATPVSLAQGQQLKRAGKINGNKPSASAETTSKPAGPAAETSAEAPASDTAKKPVIDTKVTKAKPAKTPAGTTPGTTGAEGGQPVAAAGGTRGGGGGAHARGGAGAGGGGAAKKAALDTSSSEALLDSLANVPASSFGQALSDAQSAAADVQQRERDEVQAEFPEVSVPTGLPRRDALPEKGAPQVQPGEAPEMTSEGSGGPLPDSGVPVATGPLPASHVATHVNEPQAAEEESWWEWLWGAVRGFLTQISTSDPNLSTSAGPRPKVELSGDSDPSQMSGYEQQSNASVQNARTQADAATTADFGENDIYPTVPQATIKPELSPSGLPAAEGGQPLASDLSPDVLAAFDAGAAPIISQKVEEQAAQYREAQAGYEQESVAAREDSMKQLDEETERVRVEQEGVQGQARADVEGQRVAWKVRNKKAQEDFTIQSAAKRAETQNQIDEKVRDTDKRVDDEMTKAEKQAEAEKRKTEAEAAAKKREAENKPRSFWDSVKGAIKSYFDTLISGINMLFDALRWLVKNILELAKEAVLAFIELVRIVIVGLIKVFGEVLKALVTVVLFAYPEIAAEIRNAIDGAVETAIELVNKAAEILKKIYAAIWDFLINTIDMLLRALQVLWTTALRLLSMIATGEIDELLRKLAILGEAMSMGMGMVEGEISKELIGFDLTQDLGPQLSEGGEAEEGKEGPPPADGGGAADQANLNFLLQDEIEEGQVQVDPVPEIEFDDELWDEFELEDGQEIFLGQEISPERSKEAVIQDLLAPIAEPEGTVTRPADESGNLDKEAQALDPEMKAIVQRAFTAKTKGERALVVLDLMWAGIKKYYRDTIEPNLWWIIPAAILAIAAVIALEIVTAGAVTAALPVILELIAAALLAADIARMSGHFATYLEKGMAEDKAGAARAFARGLAVGIVAVVMLALGEVAGKALKLVGKAFARAGRAVVAGAKATGKALVTGGKAIIKGVLHVGKLAIRLVKITARMIARGGKFLLERGKLIFKGISEAFAKGLKSFKDFFKRLKDFFGRFKGFSLERRGAFITVFAIFNPKIPIAILPAKGSFRDYRSTFFKAFPKLKGKVVVHHSIPRQIQTAYPGLFTEAEIHALQNLRGIPKAINADLHLSKINSAWFKFIRENPNATRRQILIMRSKIDKLFGSQFNPPV